MLARDHFGIKPLYYCTVNGRLAFASEIKALLQLPNIPRRINRTALNQYLTFLWVPDPLTMFEGIYKLEPGSTLIYRDGEIERAPFWHYRFPPADHV